jgi:hypothetical protein
MGIEGPTPDQITINVLKDHEYGIFASEDGVLLLKLGYAGPLVSYSPQTDVFDYEQLISASGKEEWDYTSASTKIITSDAANSVGMIWFGSYAYFVPGNYSAVFALRTTNETCELLLDIATQQGTLSIADRVVNGTEFKQINAWQEFSVNFEVDLPTRLEFRGIGISNNTEVSLDYVRVEQIGP